MSLLTAFAAAASKAAGAVIGMEKITIGTGPPVDAVLGEVMDDRTYVDFGHDQQQTLTAVVRLADWLVGYAAPGTPYIGKKAVARGVEFRVETVNIGQAFVTVKFQNTGKS